jgi:hypothetical protein
MLGSDSRCIFVIAVFEWFVHATEHDRTWELNLPVVFLIVEILLSFVLCINTLSYYHGILT